MFVPRGCPGAPSNKVFGDEGRGCKCNSFSGAYFLLVIRTRSYISTCFELPYEYQAVHRMHASQNARAKLTEADALDIFKLKGRMMTASSVSVKYSVSEKAVRDIWIGRTWSKETWHLDTSRSLPLKKMGRPIGRKDAQPRKLRIASKKQDPSTLRNAKAVARSQLNHVKSVDEQLHEWYLRCRVDCDFEDPFGYDWSQHLLQRTLYETEHY